MNISILNSFCDFLTKHSAPSKEFLFLWGASLSPIIFGTLFVKMSGEEVDYWNFAFNSFLNESIFAYVSTMVAPFIYLLIKFLGSKTARKEVKFGWFFIIVSLVVTLISAGSFGMDKKSEIESSRKHASSSIIVESNQALSEATDATVESNQALSEATDATNTKDVFWGLSFKQLVIIICYLMALVVWYYSIYLNSIEPPDLEADQKRRRESLMSAVDKAFGESK